MASRTISNSRLIVWILGGAVALCLCSCDRLSTSGRTVEPDPKVRTTTTARAVSTVTQTAEAIPVQAIAAQAIALATEIAQPTQTPTPTNTPTASNTPKPTATPPATRDARVLNPENQHLYLNVQRNLGWHQARDYCASLGGHLVTITSGSENDFVFQLVGSAYHSSWLGATDELQEGTWVWETGEPWNYANWDQNEPNNQDIENYLGWSVEFQPGTWNDREGRGGDSFVCEWEPVSP